MKKLGKSEEERALEIHERAVIVDSLIASIMSGEYFQKMRKGGVTATNYTIAMMHNMSETIKRILDMQDMINEEKEKVLLATSVQDVMAAKRDARVAIMLGSRTWYHLKTIFER